MKIIIIGAGEVGFHIAGKLSRENKDVVLIDRSEDRLKFVSESLDVQTIVGSGSDPAMLKEASIESADLMIAVTDSDEINLVACLLSRILSPNTRRIARIRNRAFLEMEELKSEENLGLSLVINPESEVVKTILRLLEVPGSVDVIDFADGKVRLIGLKIRSGSIFVGRALQDLAKGEDRPPILIAAIHRDGQVIIPHGPTRIQAGDLVYVVTTPKDSSQIISFLGFESSPVRFVFIMGGGHVGASLAQNLEKRGVMVKLIDRNAARCFELSQVLDRTVVLRGDGTEQTLLEEENVAQSDVFIALTNDEEENVLASLLAKRLGAAQTITRVNKFAYIPLVSAIGLDTLVSSRLSAVSTILAHIRKGKVLSAAALKSEEAEVIEVVALETSDIVGTPLAKLQFPKQALIAAIVRQGEVIIPGGRTVINPDDRIIIFARREAIPKVEKALVVKLEYFQ